MKKGSKIEQAGLRRGDQVKQSVLNHYMYVLCIYYFWKVSESVKGQRMLAILNTILTHRSLEQENESISLQFYYLLKL